MKIYDLLDEVAQDVEDSRKSMFSARKAFDADYVLTVVKAIRAVLPRELAEAQKVLDAKEQILAEARTYASAILEDARVRARRAVDQQKVVVEATQRSDQMMADTRREAAAIRRAADDYALSVLDDLSAYVTEYKGIIEENKSKYQDRRNRAVRESLDDEG